MPLGMGGVRSSWKERNTHSIFMQRNMDEWPYSVHLCYSPHLSLQSSIHPPVPAILRLSIHVLALPPFSSPSLHPVLATSLVSASLLPSSSPRLLPFLYRVESTLSPFLPPPSLMLTPAFLTSLHCLPPSSLLTPPFVPPPSHPPHNVNHVYCTDTPMLGWRWGEGGGAGGWRRGGMGRNHIPTRAT